MDLTFSEDHILLRSAVTDFLRREMPRERVLQIDDSESGFSEGLWRQMVELGWSGIATPEEYGGSGSSLVDLGILYEALGEAACPSPHLSSAVLSARLILALGNEKQKGELLPAIAQRGLLVTVADTEPEYGWESQDIHLAAFPSGVGYILDGTKLFVPDANIAEKLIVLGRVAGSVGSEEGLTAFLVDRAAAGLSVRRLAGWISDNLCEVVLEKVYVPADAVLGSVGKAWPGVEQARDVAAAALSAYMAGGARRVIDMAIDYSKTRMSYGVAIATFQRVQDHIIEGLSEADGAKWAAYEALWKLDVGKRDASIAVSIAKAAASVGFPIACECSHHVYAGNGTDLNLGLTQYTKRARTQQHFLGDATFHRRRIARLMKLNTMPTGARVLG